jgi:AraC-like DNA-binding protein
MSRARLARATPGLFQRTGFDAALEAEALRRLGELDLEGCRSAFVRLIDALDLRATAPGDGTVALLLLDVLQEVNRRVHRASPDEDAYHAHRASLIERFAACDAEDARRIFLPALDHLLTPLGPHRLSSHQLVEAACAHIEEHCSRRVSLSSVASRLHVSPSHLSRVFRRATGTTLTCYVHLVRLERATVLLAADGRSISEVAYLVGYQNYRDFYRNFVKYKKTSPRQFRRRLIAGPRAPAPVAPEGGAW